MLRGGEDSPAVVEGLRKLDKIEIVSETPNWKDQIINKEIRAAVEVPRIPDGCVNKIGHRQHLQLRRELKSEFATDKIEKYMKDYRDKVVKERLAAKNLPETVLSPLK